MTSIPACLAEPLASELSSLWGAALGAGSAQDCPVAGAFIEALWEALYSPGGGEAAGALGGGLR